MTYGDRPAPEANMFPRPFGSKYVLLKHLATGGMADVFLARQTGSAGFVKECVIKRILPHHARDQQFVAMFLDEARLCARLSHPNIAQVYDLGQEGEDYFIAMEHIHGVDLENVIDVLHARGDKRMPPAVAARILASAAEALEHAHNATDALGRPLGIVHRDVTPSNIMVSFEGIPKLLDFGIAKASHRQFKTEVGIVRGKAPYMSPEQVEGEQLDGRSDLFSLGAVLYELTTGEKPFDGESQAKIVIKILHDDPIPPSLLVDGYPQALEQVIMAALAKRLTDRIPSAREFQTQLEKFLISLGTPATTHDIANYLGERMPKQRVQLSMLSGPQPMVQAAISSGPNPTPTAPPATVLSTGAVGGEHHGPADAMSPSAQPAGRTLPSGDASSGPVIRLTTPITRPGRKTPPKETINEAIARVRAEEAARAAATDTMKVAIQATGDASRDPRELPEIELGDVSLPEEKLREQRSSLGGGGGRWMVAVILGLVAATGLGLLLLRNYQLRKTQAAAKEPAAEVAPAATNIEPPPSVPAPAAAPAPSAGANSAATAGAPPPPAGDAPAPSGTGMQPVKVPSVAPAAAKEAKPVPAEKTTRTQETRSPTRSSKPRNSDSSPPSFNELPRLPSPPPTEGP